MNIALPCMVLSSFLAVSVVATAQESKTLAKLPPTEFSFGGAWNCEGAFRSGKVHKASFTGSLVLDGKWIELTEQDIEPTTGYVAKYLIGYDSDQKRLVEFDANNFGAAVYSSDQGWIGHVLTMTSSTSQDPKAPYVMNRFLYSIVNQDSFTVDWQISKVATPIWVGADHLACIRR